MRYLKMTTNSNYNFSAKWPPELAADGFTIIPNVLIRNKARLGITDPEFAIIISLTLFRWDQRNPYPAVATLCDYMGKGDSTVRDITRSLEDKGLINRIQRNNQPTEYDFSPLTEKLKSYTQPIRKPRPPSPKVNRGTYQNTATEEDEANKNKRRRPREYSGKLESIGQVIHKRINYEQ